MAEKMMEVVVVTGKVNSGKTTKLEELFAAEKSEGKSATGIIARSIFAGRIKTGFDVVDLATGYSMPLTRRGQGRKAGFSVGKFTFFSKGFEFAEKALLNFKSRGVVFLDEVGPLELEGKGHADCLRTLLNSDLDKLYLSVRKECLAKVVKKFLQGKQLKILKIGTLV